MPRTQEPKSWGHSTVQTACPLDCPDSCTLEVTVEKGRIVEIDGGHENPSTRDYICGKVRRFAERVYGEDRLLYPAVRKGAKGRRRLHARQLGRSARPDRRAHDRDPRRARRRGDPAVLLRRLERPAHAGHQRRRRCGARSARRGWRARSARRRPAPPTWVSTARCRRHLRGLRARAADRPLGREPVGLGHPPRPLHQGSAQGRRDARRHRSARDVARPAGGPPHSRCSPAPTSPSPWRCTSTCSMAGTPTRVPRRAHARRRRVARPRRRSGRSRARPTSPASSRPISSASPSSTRPRARP